MSHSTRPPRPHIPVTKIIQATSISLVWKGLHALITDLTEQFYNWPRIDYFTRYPYKCTMSKTLSIVILTILFTFSNAHGMGIQTLYVIKITPFITINNDGEISGAAYEVVNRIMQEAGIPVSKDTFQYIPWARALDDVAHSPGHGAFCLAKTPDRIGRYMWVGPIGVATLGLYAKKSRHISISKRQEINRFTIGTVRNSAPAIVLGIISNPNDKNIINLSSNKLLVKMLSEGRLDLAAHPDTGFAQTVKAAGMNPGDFEPVYKLETVQLFLALNPDTAPELVERLQAALEKLKTAPPGEKSPFDRIHEKYRSKIRP